MAKKRLLRKLLNRLHQSNRIPRNVRKNEDRETKKMKRILAESKS